MRKWKVVGSVHSNDDRSVRSNRSREQVPFESFRQTLKNKSQNLSPEKDRSFCHDYLQKRKQDQHNFSYDQAKSEASGKIVQNGKEDIFTSMRNILKDQTVESKLTSKNAVGDPSSKLIDEKIEGGRTNDNCKQTLSKVHQLKKEQTKLKKNIESQFSSIKNMFYQLEDVLHTVQTESKGVQTPKIGDNLNEDPQMLRGILSEALSIEKFFAQMDRKKTVIMNRLSNQ